MALTQVSTGGVKDGTILNADINASASIAGSKISPIFTSATEVQNSTFKITDSNPEILLAVPSGGLDSRILNDGSGNLIIGHGVNSDTPTERLRMDSSGNVGIGTTPSQKLDISGNINTTGELRFNSATRRIFYRSGNNDMIFEGAANFFYMQDIGNTAHKWFTNSGDVRLLIQADGNVAIGGTSSSAPLFFGKSVYGEQDSENFYRIKFNDVGGTGNDVGIGQPDSASLGFNTVSNGTIRFYQGTDGEMMRLDSSGNLNIARTDVMAMGANNVTGINLMNSGQIKASASGSFSQFGRQGSNGTVIQFACRGTNDVGSISVTTTSTAYNQQASDRSLKKNFEEWTENTLQLFKNINPQKFNFIKEDDGTKKTKGYIAQDLVDSFPEAYPKNDDDKYMFNPSGMVVYLMKAIQELETEVAALKAS